MNGKYTIQGTYTDDTEFILHFDTYDLMKTKLHEDKTIWKTLTVDSIGVTDEKLPTDCSLLFYNYRWLSYLDISRLDFKNCTNCYSLASYTVKLDTIILNKNMSKVIDWIYAFRLSNYKFLDFSEITFNPNSVFANIFEATNHLTTVLCQTQADADKLNKSSNKPSHTFCYVKKEEEKEDIKIPKWVWDYITPVEYLESNGEQLINLEAINIDDNSGCKVKGSLMTRGYIPYVHGYPYMAALWQSESGIFIRYGDASFQSTIFRFGIPYDADNLYEGEINYLNSGKVGINGIYLPKKNYINAVQKTLSLFYDNNSKIHKFEFTQNESISKCLIAGLSKESDKLDKPCMFDLISREYFYNQGSGEFIAGNVIEYPEEEDFVVYEHESGVQLEYLESTGTQWIDTGIMSDNRYNSIEVTYQFKSTIKGLVYSAGGSFNHRTYEDFYHDSTYSGLYIKYNENLNSPILVPKDNMKHTFKRDKEKTFFDNVFIDNVEQESLGLQTTNYLLFAGPNSSSAYWFAPCRIYNYSNISDLISQHLIPWKLTQAVTANPDIPWSCDGAVGEVGMWDTVTDTFLGNKGTGTFIAGPNIQESKLTHEEILERRRNNNNFIVPFISKEGGVFDIGLSGYKHVWEYKGIEYHTDRLILNDLEVNDVVYCKIYGFKNSNRSIITNYVNQSTYFNLDDFQNTLTYNIGQNRGSCYCNLRNINNVTSSLEIKSVSEIHGDLSEINKNVSQLILTSPHITGDLQQLQNHNFKRLQLTSNKNLKGDLKYLNNRMYLLGIYAYSPYVVGTLKDISNVEYLSINLPNVSGRLEDLTNIEDYLYFYTGKLITGVFQPTNKIINKIGMIYLENINQTIEDVDDTLINVANIINGSSHTKACNIYLKHRSNKSDDAITILKNYNFTIYVNKIPQ